MGDVGTFEYWKVGERIRALRIERGMSQADLAARANISLLQISDIELGKTRMFLPTFVKLVEAFQVSADSLLRPDIPQVNNMYSGELAEILDGCTAKEADAILKIVKELKETMIAQRNSTEE